MNPTLGNDDAILTGIKKHLSNLSHICNHVLDREKFFERYLALYAHPSSILIDSMDAWSRGQITSKIWLINQCLELELKLGRTWILCGWIGTLSYLMLERRDLLAISTVRSFDIDKSCTALADELNRFDVKDSWRFKATTIDVNSLIYTDFTYETLRYDGSIQPLYESADTIVNTSCDHMGSNNAWWDNIPIGTITVLQNNDWSDNDQHNNTVSSIDEFKNNYPMTELLYAGELDCTLYTRYMLIGRK